MSRHPFASRGIAASLMCLTAGLAGCKKPDEVAATEVSVQAEKVEQKALTESVEGETVLVPQAQAAVVSKMSAPIRQFLVQRGSRVHKGQLLAVLENADLVAAIEDSRGAMKQADASYTTTTRAAVIEDLQKAQLDVAQTKVNLDVQQTIFDARESLLQQGAIPRRDLDTVRATLVQAKAANDIARQHLSSLQSVSQTATISSVEGARESAKGKYEAAQASLSFSEVRSPIHGVVTDRPLFAGEMANAGQAIVTVMDTSVLLAKVHLSELQTRLLKVGGVATLTVAGQKEPRHGKVILISPALDVGSTTLEVWVAVMNPEARLKAGTSVHVALASQTVPDALTVQNEALITTKSGQTAAMVVGTDGIAHQTMIKTGITDGHDTQVLSGLKAGDLVVTKGAYGMDDNTKVKVTAAEGEDDEKPAASKETADPTDEKKPAVDPSKPTPKTKDTQK